VLLVRTLLAVLLIAAATVGVPAASAHTALTGTDPAADSTLATGPGRLTATFNEELQPTFAAMTLVGPDGNLWSTGDAEVQGATVSVGVRSLGPAGKYTANYRVTSADGHVVSGSWSFTVTVPGAGQPGPAVQSPDPADRVVLWPFAIGLTALIAGALLWGLRRRRGQPGITAQRSEER
jgi:methionine-rich copper-binding protein CopC